MIEKMHAVPLSADLLEQLYYYALRKTGSKVEAEDLAQDIAVQALGSLANGSRPVNIDRWLWGIARNRYAHWAKLKRRRHAADGGPDALDLAADDRPTAEERLVRADERAALRRELSLLAAGYREIIVAYYYEGRRIADIAAKLGLPEGTVKRRLHDCRLNIREGIEMAREVGRRSFKAEEVYFSKSGSDGKDGSPWNRIGRLIPKNILLAAFRNPMTLEELCLELGVAMPYMEEEVRLLTDVTLLKEVAKGKFETDFIIVDKAMQRDIFRIVEEAGARFAPPLIALLEDVMPELQRNRQWDSQFLLWTLIPMAVDYTAGNVRLSNGWSGSYTPRPHDGRWDIVGYEQCELPYSSTTGHNGSGNERETMWCYKLGLHGLWERAGELTDHETAVLASAIRSGRRRSELGSVEQGVIGSLAARGFLADHPDTIEPLFPVFTREDARRLRQYDSHPAMQMLRSAADECYHAIYAVIGRDCPERLAEQRKVVAGEYMYTLRMQCLRYALDHGHITVPVQPERSTIAMYMTLN